MPYLYNTIIPHIDNNVNTMKTLTLKKIFYVADVRDTHQTKEKPYFSKALKILFL